MKGNREKAVCKPGKDILPETEFSGTLILDFWPPEVWENKFLLSKPSSMWYTVMATQAPHLVCYYILCCVIAYYLLYFLLREKNKKNKNGNQKHLISKMNPSIHSAFHQNSSLFFFPFSLVSVTLGHRIVSEMVVWEARNQNKEK